MNNNINIIKGKSRGESREFKESYTLIDFRFNVKLNLIINVI
jgi:hypothetical protein